jgi:chromate reductase
MAAELAPPGCEIIVWNGLASLPAFTPDLDQPDVSLPPAVVEFCSEIEAAEGLLIACPEYAHGIPGSFKNALDLLVGSTIFPCKPVALRRCASDN